MNVNSLLGRCAGLLLAGMVAALPAFASVAGTFDRSYQVNGPVDLEVLTRSGDIVIRNGAAGAVSIHGKIHVGISWFGDHKADVEAIHNNPPIRQNGNSIRVDYVNVNNVSIDYEITVPEDTAVRTHSGSGDQTVEGLKGNIDLQSGSGDMKLARLAGDMHFQTGSGDVHGHDLAGPARVKATSGDINIEETGQGDVEIRTGSGDITVKGVNGGFHAEAGSGNVRCQGTPRNLWSVRTGSGSVTLQLPPDAALDVDLSSNSGSVKTNHPVTTTVQGQVQEHRKSVVGKVRGGGPAISVHTGSGNINLD